MREHRSWRSVLLPDIIKHFTQLFFAQMSSSHFTKHKNTPSLALGFFSYQLQQTLTVVLLVARQMSHARRAVTCNQASGSWVCPTDTCSAAAQVSTPPGPKNRHNLRPARRQHLCHITYRPDHQSNHRHQRLCGTAHVYLRWFFMDDRGWCRRSY